MSTYGKIEIQEQLYHFKGSSKQSPRLYQNLKVKPGGYSSSLQRIMTDFGADVSFRRASQKLKEHYNLTIAPCSIKRITYSRASEISQEEPENAEIPLKGSDFIICESDGCMIPMMGIKEGRGDKRKRKEVFFKEGISTVSYKAGSKSPVYQAGFGRENNHKAMLNTAIKAGLGSNSQVHVVGDGAKWIKEESEKSFGSKGNYLIDFYHLCDYLFKAVASSPVKNKKSYFGRVKSLCKKGEFDQLLRWLKNFEEDKKIKNNQAPVRAAIRYIENRPGEFDYPDAIKKELPIGSGQVESTHRHLIQERMKIPGAWWKYENAAKMLALRNLRANQDWEEYWIKKAA